MQALKKIFFLVKKEDYGLYLLIFLLPWQARWIVRPGELNGGYWEYGTISLYAVDVLLLLLLAYRGSGLLRSGAFQRWVAGRVRRDTFWLIAGMVELAVVVSVLAAPREGLALYGYLRFVLAMGAGWLLLRSRVTARGVSGALLASGALQGALAWWQAAVQQVSGSTVFGMAAQTAATAGVSVVETGGERWLRAYGSLPHPNMLGGFLALCLVAGLAWCAEERSAVGRRIGWLAVALVAGGLVLSFSRAGWLAAAVGSAAYLSVAVRTGKRGAWRCVAPAVAAAALSAGAVAAVWHAPLQARLAGAERLEQRSVTERASLMADARAVIAAHPLVGAGIRNYGIAVYDTVDSGRPAYGYEPVHQTFVLVAAEIGIIGLLLFTALWAYAAAAAVSAGNAAGTGMALAAVTAMMFDHWWWSLPFGLSMSWLMAALAAQRSRPLARRRST